MGKFSASENEQPIRVPPEATDSKPTIGEKVAAAASPAAIAKKRKIILISVCSAAVFLLTAITVCIWYFVAWPTNGGLILNNVTVAGIDLSGMTAAQARQAIHEATDYTYTKTDMVITLPDGTMRLTPDKTGAVLDVDAAVKEAHGYGRIGSYEERKAAQEASLTSVHQIQLAGYLNLNLEYIKKELDDYGAGYNSDYTPSAVTFDVDRPVLDASDEKFQADAACQVMTLTIGTPGRHLDIEKVYNQVLDAYNTNHFLVTTQLESPEELPEPLDVEELHKELRSEPAASYWDPKTFDVIPEIYGYDFDLEKALEQMEQAKYGDKVEVPFRYLLPEVLGSELSSVMFRDVLGAYETQHTTDENRNNNLRLACAAINGLILGPGDTFDFNTVVGERTAAAGYKRADAYSSGETVKTLGGGICQVSSTLYYCTLIADLEIVARTPHSYVSSYMPMGMDATVSWGGPEFTFKNNTNYPIRIEAKVEDGLVKIQLLGTDEKNYYIEMEYQVIGTQSPETIYKEMKSNNAEGYKDGDVITTSYKGYTVRTYKLKYDKETKELISKEEDRVSKYKKRDKVVVKIVKDKKPSKTESKDDD